MSNHPRYHDTRFQFRFEKRDQRREERAGLPKSEQTEPPKPAWSAPPVAFLLALAHHMQSQVEDGVVTSYADLSERRGTTRARITQIMNLLLLAPDIQEDMLLKHDTRITERHVRRLVSAPAFPCQRRHWSVLLAETSPADGTRPLSASRACSRDEEAVNPEPRVKASSERMRGHTR